MGMGDQKPQYKPFHKTVKCAKCGHEYADITVRVCNHPAVVKVYGKPITVCMYCCGKKPCPYYARVPYTGLVSCTLEVKDGKREE